MRGEHVVGDMQVSGDATVDGWCWAPDRPDAALAFEILVDDRLVGGGEASLPRPDLAVHGMQATEHGFWMALPPGCIDRAAPCLVSARARDGGVVFGRRRLDPADAPADPAVQAMQSTLAAMSERLAAWPPPRDAGRLRAATRTLSLALAARHGEAQGAIAAARRVLAGAAPLPDLARPARPRASLVLRASGQAPETLQRLRLLAPATHALAAETLLVDAGEDARTALLPSLVPGLRLCASWTEAAQNASGVWLLLLDDAARPSAAGLEALAARLQASAMALALSARLAAAAGLPVWRLAAPAGVALAVRRVLVAAGDDAEALARRLGDRGVALAEPGA